MGDDESTKYYKYECFQYYRAQIAVSYFYACMKEVNRLCLCPYIKSYSGDNYFFSPSLLLFFFFYRDIATMITLNTGNSIDLMGIFASLVK